MVYHNLGVRGPPKVSKMTEAADCNSVRSCLVQLPLPENSRWPRPHWQIHCLLGVALDFACAMVLRTSLRSRLSLWYSSQPTVIYGDIFVVDIRGRVQLLILLIKKFR